MNSGISPKPIFIAFGALLFLAIINRREPSIIETKESNALPVYSKPDNKQRAIRYKYRVEIETRPENQLYSIRKSGYKQYAISRTGASYSYEVYEFYSDKLLNEQECYNFVINHPNQCTRINAKDKPNIYDSYNEGYENYLNDPEDEINYPPETFDFLVD